MAQIVKKITINKSGMKKRSIRQFQLSAANLCLQQKLPENRQQIDFMEIIFLVLLA